jgi:uncharacterized protein (UPF0548 family)
MKIRFAPLGIRPAKDPSVWGRASANCRQDFSSGHQDEHRVVLGRGDRVFRVARDTIAAYRMFPAERLLATFDQGECAQVGTTVAQCVKLAFLEFEMANRIVSIFDRDEEGVREFGIQIVSLEGHAEQGVETFKVVQDIRGEVTFQIIANSKPGLMLTRFFSPLTRWVQLRASRECMRHMVECCR